MGGLSEYRLFCFLKFNYGHTTPLLELFIKLIQNEQTKNNNENR